MNDDVKRGRGRPKGAPNKPKMELIQERVRLPKNADVYEILCQADLVAPESEDNAINGLITFAQTNGALEKVLMWAFSDRITSKLPEGKTPYKPNDAPASDLSETALRRESMWIELLEGIPAKEAELMELVKDKVWPFKNITKEIAQKAFPNVNF